MVIQKIEKFLGTGFMRISMAKTNKYPDREVKCMHVSTYRY